MFKNKIFPPGTILQRIFLKERLKNIEPGKFVEVGCGCGDTSRLLLERGWEGLALELSKEAADEAKKNNQEYVNTGKFKVITQDFLSFDKELSSDLVISNMVIEHLSDEEEQKYFEKCKTVLNKSGQIIFTVPAGMKFWNIEDEIAGHYRRYDFQGVEEKLEKMGFSINTVSGLTYPLSNFFYRLSNALIRKQEGYKLDMSIQDRTILSGNREVKFKTEFPKPLKLILNEFVMYPFHILQKIFSKNPNALIIFAEATLK